VRSRVRSAAEASVTPQSDTGALPFPAIPLDRDPFVAEGARAGHVAAVLRGIVSGEQPRALIEIGSGVRVVGVGDRVGDDTVTAIGAGSVQLSGGSTLWLTAAHP